VAIAARPCAEAPCRASKNVTVPALLPLGFGVAAAGLPDGLADCVADTEFAEDGAAQTRSAKVLAAPRISTQLRVFIADTLRPTRQWPNARLPITDKGEF
jgi:hypothetical protein